MILLDGPGWPVVGHPYGAHTDAMVEARQDAPPPVEALALFAALPATDAPGKSKRTAPAKIPAIRCGGRLVWSWVPPQEDDEQSPGEATCARCGTVVYAWPDAYGRISQAQADAAIVAAGEVDDEEDATLQQLLGITAEVRAAALRWLSSVGLPRTEAQRSEVITAWLGSELAAQLGADGVSVGAALGIITAAFPRQLEAA
jgi:hypothetical protein